MALVCRGCQRALLDAEVPDDPRTTIRCPKCDGTEFIATGSTPKRPWRLSWNDRQFLKTLRIRGE